MLTIDALTARCDDCGSENVSLVGSYVRPARQVHTCACNLDKVNPNCGFHGHIARLLPRQLACICTSDKPLASCPVHGAETGAAAADESASTLPRELRNDRIDTTCPGCGQTPCRWSVPCGRRAERRAQAEARRGAAGIAELDVDAGVEWLRTYRGDAALDLGNDEQLRQLAADFYHALATGEVRR